MRSFKQLPHGYLVENPPSCYSLQQFYLAYGLKSRISVQAHLRATVHCHASHALWDVTKKSGVRYHDESTMRAKSAHRPDSWKLFLICVPIRLINITWRVSFY